MLYTFENLSFADFEDLVRDLLAQELGVRFEAFGAGPDSGMDGRHAAADGTTVIQAKHYAGSVFSSLKAEMVRARPMPTHPNQRVTETACGRMFSKISTGEYTASGRPRYRDPEHEFGLLVQNIKRFRAMTALGVRAFSVLCSEAYIT
jgi:hypothetical protein